MPDISQDFLSEEQSSFASLLDGIDKGTKNLGLGRFSTSAESPSVAAIAPIDESSDKYVLPNLFTDSISRFLGMLSEESADGSSKFLGDITGMENPGVSQSPEEDPIANPSRKNNELVQPRYVTTGDPDSGRYLVRPGEEVNGLGLDGVVRLENSMSDVLFCSGALLSTGKHILTAGHCVISYQAEDLEVVFDLPRGEVRRQVSNIFMPDEFTNFFSLNDIAIVELESEAPSRADRYDIYRDEDEIGKVSLKVGYGMTGQGTTDQDLGSKTKRMGFNVYDDVANEFDDRFFGADGFIPDDKMLAYDFDNGEEENDAFGELFGKADTGLGKNEVNSSLGDSGGPTFIDGAIAGITSFGLGKEFGVTTDVDDETNSSFGEVSVDTRVGAYADWIDGIINGNIAPVEAPDNDKFANRETLAGTSVTTTGSNRWATAEPGEGPHWTNFWEPELVTVAVRPFSSSWWSWEAPEDMTVAIDTMGSTIDSVLAVYTGSDLSELTPIAKNDDAGGTFQSKVVFEAKAGETYQIAVDSSFGDQGDIVLNLNPGERQGYDINSDGNIDLLWRNPTTGKNQAWQMNGVVQKLEQLNRSVTETTEELEIQRQSPRNLPRRLGPRWDIVGTGDFDGNGKDDLLWRNDRNGKNQIWLMKGQQGNKLKEAIELPKRSNTNWDVVGTGDFNADGELDILWRNGKNGRNQVWLMDGTERVSSVELESRQEDNWDIAGAGDFSADGSPDILWRNSETGENQLWYMDGTQKVFVLDLQSRETNWDITGTGDFDRNGDADIIWRDSETGDNDVWLMNGGFLWSQADLPARPSQKWEAMG
ncbi:MAG: FG-GAP-like repeat-containing protein [Cyanobacteriota bacterium]|nr:FG-GAP-like repeat-containing protein [Cyanobacteriota bacterium]